MRRDSAPGDMTAVVGGGRQKGPSRGGPRTANLRSRPGEAVTF